MKRAFDCIVELEFTNNQTLATVKKTVTFPLVCESADEAVAKCKSVERIRMYMNTYIPAHKQSIIACTVGTVVIKP
jgi:hypothetical protein